MVSKSKNNSKLLKDSKDGLDVSRITKQTHDGMATVRSNYSSNQKNANNRKKATSPYNSQLPRGVASNYNTKVGGGEFSPNSQMI